jgi:hypothetical protein
MEDEKDAIGVNQKVLVIASIVIASMWNIMYTLAQIQCSVLVVDWQAKHLMGD